MVVKTEVNIISKYKLGYVYVNLNRLIYLNMIFLLNTLVIVHNYNGQEINVGKFMPMHIVIGTYLGFIKQTCFGLDLGYRYFRQVESDLAKPIALPFLVDHY